MKYLKTFEAKKEFNIGDIVLFKEKYADETIPGKDAWAWKYRKMVGKIRERSEKYWIIEVPDDRMKNKYSKYWVTNSLIMRFAKGKELDDYNFKTMTNSYNL